MPLSDSPLWLFHSNSLSCMFMTHNSMTDPCFFQLSHLLTASTRALTTRQKQLSVNCTQRVDAIKLRKSAAVHIVCLRWFKTRQNGPAIAQRNDFLFHNKNTLCTSDEPLGVSVFIQRWPQFMQNRVSEGRVSARHFLLCFLHLGSFRKTSTDF